MNTQRKYKILLILTGLGISGLFFSCSNGREKETHQQHKQVPEETLIRTNQYLVEKDDERIRQFIKRHRWHMDKTGTGLWYQIYHHGNGEQITEGKWVTIFYKIYLLDGTLCYSSDETGPKTFRVGHGGVTSGVEQGILMLKKGDKARFILPPFLAYGVPGDHHKIPPRSVIIYNLEVKNIK